MNMNSKSLALVLFVIAPLYAQTRIPVVLSTDVGNEVDDQWVQRLLRCQESGTHVVRLAQLYEDTLGREPVEHVGSDRSRCYGAPPGAIRQ